jgi:cytochrome c-type biogenesis protein CcmH/NrfG
VTEQLSVARTAAAGNDAASAIAAYQRVLELDPDNIEANTYAGWLIVTSGQAAGRADFVDAGIAQLRRAIDIDTTYTDAHCLLGVALVRFAETPDPVEGKAELEACLADNPPQQVRALVEPVLASLDTTPTS